MTILNSGTLLAASVFASIIEISPQENDVTWRLGLGFGAVLSAITLGLRACLLEESPAFTQTAADATTLQGSSVEFSQISNDSAISLHLNQHQPQPLITDETRLLLGIDEVIPANQLSLITRCKETLNNPWLKPLMGTACTWFLYDICTFGIGLYSSQILSEKDAIKSAATSIVLSSALALPFSVLAMVTMNDKLLGRQKSQLLGTLGMAAMLSCMAISKNILWTSNGDEIHFDTNQQRTLFTALFCAYQSFNAIGPGTSIFAYSSEIFPAHLRGTLHGIAAAAGKTGAAVGAISFPYLKKILGTQGCLLLMSSVCAITALITKLSLPNYTNQHLSKLETMAATATSQEIVDMLYDKNDTTI